MLVTVRGGQFMRLGTILTAATLVVWSAAPSLAQQSTTGNGAPSGSHFNLNILGFNNCPGGTFTDSNRHEIAVFLNFNDGSQAGKAFTDISKNNKILLSPGTDFQVTDGNACDGDGAAFTLPSDVSSTYFVFIRALGSPQGLPTGTITTCAVDSLGTVVCSTADDVVNLARTKGQQKFTNVTKQLLFICVDNVTVNGACDNNELVPLFGAPYQTYFWDYDNNGIKNAQLRFYPIE